MRAHHRIYLKEIGLQHLIPIQNGRVLYLIHQNFRLQYLRDVVLPMKLDDPSISTLNSIEFFNKMEIVKGLYEDDSFLLILFQKLNDAVNNHSQLCRVLTFIQEMCNLAKLLPPQNRHDFYASLTQSRFALLPTLEHVLGADDVDSLTYTRALEILINIVVHDAKQVRVYMEKILVRQSELHDGSVYEKYNSSFDTSGILFFQICRHMIVNADAGVQAQAAELIKLLIDPEGMEGSEKDTFLEQFYNSYIRWMLYPFTRPEHEDYAKYINVTTEKTAKQHIVEILSFCVLSHGYRAKYFLFRGNICARILALLREKEKHLVLGMTTAPFCGNKLTCILNILLVGIRFIRTCIGLKDEFYHRYIVMNDLLRPVFEVFKQQACKNNMVTSAVLELMEFVCQVRVVIIPLFMFPYCIKSNISLF